MVHAVFLGGVLTFLFGVSSLFTPHSFVPESFVAQTVVLPDTDLGGSTTTVIGDTTGSTVTTNESTVVQDTTNTVVNEVPIGETNTTTAMPPLYLPCPFPQQENRVLIDFTKGGTVDVATLMLVANLEAKNATRAQIVQNPIPAGTYAVHLASFDDHHKDSSVEYQEKWFATFFGSDGKALFTSPPTRDLRDTETHAIERVSTDALVTAPIHKVMVRHSVYPNNIPNSVAPLCIALDRVAPLETEVNQTETTTVSGVSTTTTSIEETMPTTTIDVNQTVACPIPKRDGRIIVDYTKGGTVPLRDLVVRADGTTNDATRGYVSSPIPRGTYDVRIASHRVVPDHAGEVCQAFLLGVDGTMVARTPISRDIPAWETIFVSRVSESFSLTKDVARVAGAHALYPKDTAFPVAILCMSFDRTDVPGLPQPVQDTTANSSSSTPTVTQETAVVPVSEVQTAPTPYTAPSPVSAPSYTAPTNVAPQTTAVPVVKKEPAPVYKDPISTTPYATTPREAVAPRASIESFALLDRASERERIRIVESKLKQQETSGAMVATTSLTRTVLEHPEEYPPMSHATSGEMHNIRERGGLAILRDSDGDGISDYDEEHIYKTDPHNPFTSGSVLADGERVLLGLDVHTDDVTPIAVQSPRIPVGTVDKNLVVSNVTYVDKATDEGVEERSVHITGIAQPFLFVTLYVYSTPIVVTVRADVDGRFEYTLDKALSDGSHEVYVTNVDNSGRILAKSPPIPFVKTAEAISFTPPASVDGPAEEATRTSLSLLLMAMLLISAMGIIGIGVWKSQHTTPVV